MIYQSLDLACWQEYGIILLLIIIKTIKFMAALNGEVAVPCSLQPAIAGLNSVLRPVFVTPAGLSSVEDWVPRNRNL